MIICKYFLSSFLREASNQWASFIGHNNAEITSTYPKPGSKVYSSTIRLKPYKCASYFKNV